MEAVSSGIIEISRAQLDVEQRTVSSQGSNKTHENSMVWLEFILKNEDEQIGISKWSFKVHKVTFN